MSSHVREGVIDEIHAAACKTAINETVIIVEILAVCGYTPGRIYSAIKKLQQQGRWPFRIVRFRPGEPKPPPLPPKPKREKPPRGLDIEAWRAWAERERERLAEATKSVLIRSSGVGPHITKFGKARKRRA